MAAATNGAKPALPANNTLYCSNLPDKLPKDDLKRALYMLFTTYGPVLDIVALKTSKMRGQAHVLFRDREASAQAMRALQDFDFFGKPMRIKYAISKSDTLSKLDGTYKQPQPSSEAQGTSTQQSVFAGPPGAKVLGGTSAVNGKPATNGAAESLPLRSETSTSADNVSKPAQPDSATEAAQEDSDEEEDGDAPMDMDDAAMDMSDDD